MAPVLKTGRGAIPSWVRIPLLPPKKCDSRRDESRDGRLGEWLIPSASKAESHESGSQVRTLYLPPDGDLLKRGSRGRFAKPLAGRKPWRGFESHSLRHIENKAAPSWRRFLCQEQKRGIQIFYIFESTVSALLFMQSKSAIIQNESAFFSAVFTQR